MAAAAFAQPLLAQVAGPVGPIATQPAKPAISSEMRLSQLAAGWRAGFTCSGVFVAGLSPDAIEATDMQGGYPELMPIVAQLKADIDHQAKRVTVAIDAKNVRVAQYVQGRGCVQMPADVDLSTVSMPPELIAGLDLKKLDARAWPLGDRVYGAGYHRPNKAQLDQLVAQAFKPDAYNAGDRTSAVIVIKDGHILAERYGLGIDMHTPQRTWSVAKSLTSALVGRAQMLGVIDVSKPAWVQEWEAANDPRAGITTDHLLRMQSGLNTNGPGNRTDDLYFGGATVSQTAAKAPLEVPPATRFWYANNDTVLAARSLQNHLGEAAETFAYTHLLWPLGMTRTTIETDWEGAPVTSSQVYMTARDMARLATLYLNDGVWNGQRLLPENWVADSLRADGPQPEATRKMGFGRSIWLLDERLGYPAGSFAFVGNRGQYAVVVPSAKLIVVRRGFDMAGKSFDGPAFARDVLALLN